MENGRRSLLALQTMSALDILTIYIMIFDTLYYDLNYKH